MVNYNIIYQQNINSLFTNKKCLLVTTEGITFGNEEMRKKMMCYYLRQNYR